MASNATLEQTDRSRQFAAVLAVAAWAGLAGSLASGIAGVENIGGILQTVSVFASYFTIWTNVGVAVALTATLVWPDSLVGRFFRRPGVVTGLAASIALVGLAYELLLRSVWDPVGLALAADLLVHYLVPAGFVGYWWLVTPGRALSWRGPVVWLWYPVVYAAAALARGAATGFYPYPFLDAAELGYGPVLVNVAGLGVGFLALSWVLVGVGRMKGS